MKIDTVSQFHTFLILGSIATPLAGLGIAFAEGTVVINATGRTPRPEMALSLLFIAIVPSHF